MVEVKVRDEAQVDRRQVDVVEERQGDVSGVPGVYAAVEHDGLSLKLQEAARSADFLPGAERSHLERVACVLQQLGR